MQRSVKSFLLQRVYNLDRSINIAMVQYKIEVPLLSQILMEDVTGEKKKKNLDYWEFSNSLCLAQQI